MTTHPRRRSGRSDRDRRRGFSTMEALASVILTMMTLGSIYAVQQAQLKAFAAQRTYSQSQVITRSVMDLMTRELRMAGFNPTGAAIPPHTEVGCNLVPKVFIEATSTKVRFRQDLNANGVIDVANSEDVTYELVGTQIRRSLGDGLPTVLVDNVPSGGLVFQYFNNSTPPVELLPKPLAGCQLSNIAKVRILVKADLKNQVKALFRSTAESEIAVRNRSLSNI